jgi:hypothetical protein
VRYDELAPMLLNEVQQQQRKNAAQDTKISQLTAQLAEMHAALEKLRKDVLVAHTWTPPYAKQFVAVQEDR